MIDLKRALTLVLTFLALSLSFTSRADIKGKCGDNIIWTLDSEGHLVINGEGKINDYSKSSLPWRSELVRSVEISEGITYIGNNFINGSKIQILNLPSTLKEVGKFAFANCKKMVSATLPYGLIVIGESAFENCPLLAKIQIPSSVKTIGAKAFADCKMISAIGIPERAEVVGNKVFDGCRALAELTMLPEFITQTNCRIYGLDSSIVKNYGKREVSTTSTIAASEVADNLKDNSKRNSSVKAAVKYGESDIDRYVPVCSTTNSRTFAFIIANEKYSTMPDVPFAINDGKSFAFYCHSTLGIPENNINVFYNATNGNILAAMEYLKQIDETFKGDVSFIIYYAGHGAPDEKTSSAYLIPTDAYGINEKYCYPLETLYSELGKLKAKSVKVFMDACFSGVDRANDMLAQGGRLVATVPKKASVSGNVVVVSATSNDQAAWHYAPQGHGLFTYCLIKKLQETEGDISMGELSDYLQEQVPMISIVQNRVTQTPTLQSSPKLGTSWRLWQLKQ